MKMIIKDDNLKDWHEDYRGRATEEGVEIWLDPESDHQTINDANMPTRNTQH